MVIPFAQHRLLKSFLRAPAFIVALIPLSVHAQFDRETGLLPITNYSPMLEKVKNDGTKLLYSAQPQNWAAVEDRRGIMYFGNKEGVLEYDGVRWQKITIGKDEEVKSMAIDRSGRIYVGSIGEFGYLVPNDTGALQYRSLLKYVPEKLRSFRDVWRTHAASEGIYFLTRSVLFLWTGDTVKTWETATSFHKSYYVDSVLYLMQDDVGLCRIRDGKLRVACSDERMQSGIESVVPYEEGRLLAITENSGLLLVSVDDANDSTGRWKVTDLPSAAGSFLRKNRVYNAIRIDDRHFSLGTWGEGLVIINKQGDLLQVIDKSRGLQDGIIHAQYIDSDGNLWLALGVGIAKVDVRSPLSLFNDRNGLDGMVQSVVRFNGKLFAGTLLGVYYLNEPEIRGDGEGKQEFYAEFRQVGGLTSECWTLLPFSEGPDKRLLLAMNDGIYEYLADQTHRMIFECAPWSLYRSQYDERRVYVGLDDGLASLYYDNGRWINEGKVEGIEETAFNIAEDNFGDLWLGTFSEGVVRIVSPKFVNHRMVKPAVERFGKKHGIPIADPVFVNDIGGRLYFASYKGLYEFYPGHKTFRPSDRLGKQFADTATDLGIHRMATDAMGHTWVVKVYEDEIEIGFVIPRSGKEPLWVSTPFAGISKEIKYAIYHDAYGVTWLGGVDGLYRYDAKIEKNYQKPYKAFVRRVVTGSDEMIFMGASFDERGLVESYQPDALKPTLSYKKNSLKFLFSASDYENTSGLMFSYYLQGNDEGWSDWGEDTYKEYTNLPEGRYYFRVKAKNVYGHESEEATYEFTILPPWYRTVWAYIGYVLGFIGFVFGAVVISTRSLKAVIRERTAEVVKQKEIVEEKNKDILDSIRYAKRIQEAILPSPAWLKENFSDAFILYKPKDIVSGDFYWIRKVNGEMGQETEKLLFAAVDCTGHGVPGAFMSIMGHNSLNHAVNVKGFTAPAEILDYLNRSVSETLRQKQLTALHDTPIPGEHTADVHDGMDLALCSLDIKSRKLQYAGAFNPLYIIRNSELIETKADKHPIGSFFEFPDKRYRNYDFELRNGDAVYVFSDGFADQFGGPDGKKFKYKQFKELLLSIQEKTMEEQGRLLDRAITDWMRGYEQIDDICVIGVKV